MDGFFVGSSLLAAISALVLLFAFRKQMKELTRIQKYSIYSVVLFVWLPLIVGFIVGFKDGLS